MARKPKPEPEVAAARSKHANATSFKVGNRFWEARTTKGRDKLFATPEILWEACVEYFNWVHDNPLQSAEAFAYRGDVTLEEVPKMRAMTIRSLTLFLDITESTWWDYAKRPAYSEICERVGRVIYDQKFTGASAGLLNHAIIARDLGLVDKKELAGPGGGPVKVIRTDMSAKEAMEAYQAELRNEE